MIAHSIKTDNHNVSHKVMLRRMATRELKDIRVLDLFAGNNVLWSHFDCAKYYGIEIEKGKGKNLHADNLRVIASLDLSQFNVIDCDSYGIPIKQLEQLFENKTLASGTVIIYTCIGNALSGCSNVFLRRYNLTRMYGKVKTLFNKRGREFFYAWLAENGVKSVMEYTEASASFDKHYGFFVVK